MVRKIVQRLVLALALASLAACASTVDDGSGGAKLGDLGPDMQEFETQAAGGTFRFQYVAESADSYRTVFWRQGNVLSDDRTDAKVATDAVRTVFNSRFCKDAKKPAVFADDSPAPLGKAGLWSASLKCAIPPPPKPKEKKPEKPAKPAPAAEAKSDAPSEEKPKTASETAETKPASDSAPAKPVAKSYDGPMTCKRVGEKFECTPKK